MLYNIIKNYTKNLTKDDIIKYSDKNNHHLNINEVNIIYDEIKNNLDNILKYPEYSLDKIKDKLEYTTYLKIQNLIYTYKEKYKDYL